MISPKGLLEYFETAPESQIDPSETQKIRDFIRTNPTEEQCVEFLLKLIDDFVYAATVSPAVIMFTDTVITEHLGNSEWRFRERAPREENN